MYWWRLFRRHEEHHFGGAEVMSRLGEAWQAVENSQCLLDFTKDEKVGWSLLEQVFTPNASLPQYST